jgi:hypothetical protein
LKKTGFLRKCPFWGKFPRRIIGILPREKMGGGQEKRGNQVGFHCPPARQRHLAEGVEFPEKNASFDRLEAHLAEGQ